MFNIFCRDIITSNSVTLGPNEALVLLYTGSS